MTQEQPNWRIPIVVDCGRTNFRIGYGGDEKPRTINDTVYWQDPATKNMNYSAVPTDRSVPVYSIFNSTNSSQLTIDNFTDTRLPNHEHLLNFMEFNTLDELNLRNDLDKYPFLFSREDRSDKIQYPEPKKEKNGERKDYMAIVKQQEELKKMTLKDEKYMDNHIPRLNYDKLIFDFVEKTGV